MSAPVSEKGKWTPGPWRIRGTASIASTDDSPTGRHYIANLESFNRPANAHLIAAAPDLAHELDRITVYRVEDDDRLYVSIDGHVAAVIPHQNEEEQGRWLQFDAAQRAVLARARGEQP